MYGTVALWGVGGTKENNNKRKTTFITHYDDQDQLIQDKSHLAELVTLRITALL